jgi:putative ABC transport system permease protein
MIGRLFRQLRFMLHRNRSEKDLQREIRFHIEMEAREHLENGMNEGEARRRALRDFGSMPVVEETVREAWGLRIWSDLQRDFRHAFRMIRRKPGFAALTVVTMAIGVGATSAVFSVVDQALLKPLPYREPDRLVHLWETRTNRGTQMEASYPNFQDWKKLNHSFEDIAGYNGTNFTLTDLGLPRRVSAVRVTTNMMSVLGVRPQIGRDFTPQEEAPGTSHVALVTHRFWQSDMGARPEALLQTLRLGGVPYSIVGVLPEDFRFDADNRADLFIPLEATPDQVTRRFFHWLRPIARLKNGVSPAAAENELKGIAAQLVSTYPDSNAGTSARLVPLQDQLIGSLRPVLFVVFGASVCMLCLAFANLANVMVAQSATRQREVAIRTAVGASAFRIGRQVIAESLVLAALAGAASLFVATWTLSALLASIPPALLGNFRTILESHIDWRVVLFDLALTLTGGLFSGMVVALRLSRSSLSESIRTTSVDRHTNQRLRTFFTVVEVSLAVMLLVGAVVMVQSVRRLVSVDPGFNTKNLISMQLSLPSSRYPKSANVASFYKELQSQASSIPGVQQAAVIDESPLTNDGGTVFLHVKGRPDPRPGDEIETVYRSASAGYFETMEIPLKSGRTFQSTDTSSTPNVIVLNETLARQLFPNEDPVGQRVIMPFNKSEWDVIGVVGDVRLAELDRGIRPTLYTNAVQDPSPSSYLLIRTTTDVENMSKSIREGVQRMDAELPVYGIRSMDQTVSQTYGVSSRRLVLYLVGAFSSMGVLMAGIGLYGLMTFVVAQRSKEIGIRIALGASGLQVRRLVLNQAMMLMLVGLGIGVAVAVAGGRVLQSVVFGVSPSNPLVLIIVSSIVALITCLACYVPVRRALRTDPIIVLRHD